MLVSVLLPTKNEDAKIVNSFIARMHSELRNYRHEIVVIDKSKVPLKVRNARLVRQKTDGYGNAIVEGIKATKGDVIVTIDGDGSHDPKDIKKLLKMSEKYDIVMGSRYAKGATTGDKFVNIIASRFFCTFASAVLGLGLKDPMNGLALFKKEIFNHVTLRPRGYKVHMETIFKAKKLGFTASEVPTNFHHRIAGKSNRGFGTKEAIRIIIYILELRFGLR